jgi:hypothetical protein
MRQTALLPSEGRHAENFFARKIRRLYFPPKEGMPRLFSPEKFDGFTSLRRKACRGFFRPKNSTALLPSEGRHAEDFFARKIRRLWPGSNPRSWVPEVSILTTRSPKPLNHGYWIRGYGGTTVLYDPMPAILQRRKPYQLLVFERQRIQSTATHKL